MRSTSRTTTRLLEGLFDPAAEDVWREFDDHYRAVIAGFLRHLGVREDDAADIAQEALVRFVRDYREGRYDRSRGRLRSWLIGIVKHVLAEHRARGVPGRRGESAMIDLADDEALGRTWDTARQAFVLRRAMEELRETTRVSEQSVRAFEMVVFHHRSPEDVAGELGLSRHDVYVAKHRVAEKLRGIVPAIEALYDADQ